YAQSVVAHQRSLMRIPGGMSWAEAAAIPNVFVTAHDALVTNAAARPGESVMVTAGPSGVGTAAIQIARHIGAHPARATARKRASIIGVTFRTRTPEESLACSERFAAHLLDALAKGALKPVLDRTFPFDRLTDAHQYMLSDAQTGKIVLLVDAT